MHNSHIMSLGRLWHRTFSLIACDMYDSTSEKNLILEEKGTSFKNVKSNNKKVHRARNKVLSWIPCVHNQSP